MRHRKPDWVKKGIIAAAVVMFGLIAYWFVTGNFVAVPVFAIAALTMVGLGAVEKLRYFGRAAVSKEDIMRDNILRGMRD